MNTHAHAHTMPSQIDTDGLPPVTAGLPPPVTDAQLTLFNAALKKLAAQSETTRARVLQTLDKQDRDKIFEIFESLPKRIDAVQFEEEQDSQEATHLAVWQKVKREIKQFFRSRFPSPKVFHYHLETPRSYFEKIRRTPLRRQQPFHGNWFSVIWTFIASFTAIACVGILDQYFTVPRYNWPVLFASHGALSTLIFSLSEVPATQPYPMYMGTALSTVLAVSWYKLISTELKWFTGALAVSTSLVVMELFGASHPPGGALALFFVTGSPAVHELGWWFPIAAFTGVTILFLVAFLINNIPKFRKYPSFWL